MSYEYAVKVLLEFKKRLVIRVETIEKAGVSPSTKIVLGSGAAEVLGKEKISFQKVIIVRWWPFKNGQNPAQCKHS